MIPRKDAASQVERLFGNWPHSRADDVTLDEWIDWVVKLDVGVEVVRDAITLSKDRFHFRPDYIELRQVIDEIRGGVDMQRLKERVLEDCLAALGHRKRMDGEEAGWTLLRILEGHREICQEELDASWQEKPSWRLRLDAIDVLIAEQRARGRRREPPPIPLALPLGAGE